MTIQTNKEHSSEAFNSVLYCINTAFPHPYSYAKSDYLGPIYLFIHSKHINLKHSVLDQMFETKFLFVLKFKTEFLLQILKDSRGIRKISMKTAKF